MKIDFKSIIDSLTVPTFVIDKHHTVLAWNSACELLTGIKAQDIIGSKDAWLGFYDSKRPCLVDLVVDGAEDPALEQWYSVHGKAKFSKGMHAESWLTTHNGKRRYLIFDAVPIYDEKGELIAGIENLEDITEIKEVEERLMLSDSVFTYTNQAIMITDAEHRIIHCNRSFTRLTGYTIEEVKGQSSGILQSGRHNDEFYQKMQQSLDRYGNWDGEIWDKRKDGDVYCINVSVNSVTDPNTLTTSHYISIFSDITERKKTEDQIRHIAFHDALTGLPNRTLFEDRLETAIKNAKRNASMMALMFLDLDRFKAVNDTLGHHVGDQLLQEVATRLQGLVRETDTVARLGGDEFLIILPNVRGEKDVSKLARKILLSLNKPICLQETEVYTPPSIGISLFPMDGVNSETLMQSADSAMYYAKHHGKNNYSYFTHAMTEAAQERAEIEHDLRLAIEHDELELHYQPKLELITRSVVGCEALLRWNRKGKGYIPPEKFIQIAEEAGLMTSLGDWIIHQAICDLSHWKKAGLGFLSMAINLSPIQFNDPQLTEKIMARLTTANIPAEAIEFEITENILMTSIESSSETLTNLKQHGFKLAIDDFGTGYSSLAYLKLFDINTLKVDKSFVHDIQSSSNSAEIVSAVISLAHNMGLTVVAEGVENIEQVSFLSDLNCELCQGFFFSEPLNATAFYEYVKPYCVASS